MMHHFAHPIQLISSRGTQDQYMPHRVGGGDGVQPRLTKLSGGKVWLVGKMYLRDLEGTEVLHLFILAPKRLLRSVPLSSHQN
jgi:hypothetical protein